MASLADLDPALLEHLSDAEVSELIVAFRAELVEMDRAWVLNPRQARAEQFTRETEVFELLYGGAAGGGKSEWLLHHMYQLAKAHPHFHGLLIRRTFPELRRSLIMRSWERFDPDICKYHASDHVWKFKNHATIEFGYLESDTDVYQYQSAEYDCIGFDELTQFPTDFPYTYLMSRCRTTIDKRARGVRPHVIAGTNPGGVGGAWVKDRFIDVGPPEQIHEKHVVVRGKTRIIPRVYVPAKLTDNPYLGDDYAIALAGLPEAIRAALEDGSWDVVEGQYFTEWDREVHVVDPFAIPASWRRIRGLDYGFANPMCCLWAAIDPDGNVWVYRELYGTEMTPGDQADTILEMSVMSDPPVRERVDYTVADPSIWTRTGAGPPIAQQYADRGLQCRKANNARVDGWARVREYLKIDKRTHLPRLFIFSTCTNLVRTLPMLVHDKTHTEDLNTRGEDHAADALRYLVMSRPMQVKVPASTQPPGADAQVWQRILSKKRNRRKGVTGSPVGDLR